jgi:hypothetical protein
MARKIAILTGMIVVLAFACTQPAVAQDWFKTGTGLGVAKVRLAVPDFGARTGGGPPPDKKKK